MNTFFTTLLVGISLSMDAFSLALIYGTQNINRNSKIILSVIVGIYHFFMPLLGVYFGNFVTNFLFFELNILVSFIFVIIGIEMIMSSFKNKERIFLSTLIGYFIFGFSVSVDSFTTGIGLSIINSNYLEVSFVFCIVSALFTLFGLILGNKLERYFGKLSTIFGGIILIILGFYYFFK